MVSRFTGLARWGLIALLSLFVLPCGMCGAGSSGPSRSYAAVAVVSAVSRPDSRTVRITLDVVAWKDHYPGEPRRLSAEAAPEALGRFRYGGLAVGQKVSVRLSRDSRGVWRIGGLLPVVDSVTAVPGSPEAGGVLPGVSLSVFPNPVSRGGRARLEISIRNTTGRDLMYLTPSGQHFDVSARRDGKVVWTWSRGRFFTAAVMRRTLKAGEIRRLQAEWDLKGDDGKPAPAGRYKLTAWLTISGNRKPESPAVELVVR